MSISRFPEPTVNKEGRLEVVQHSHPNNVNAHMYLACTAGTSYDIILVDVSDTTSYKHTGTNYIHIENLALQIDAENNAAYIIQFGFLENVDGTNGDFYEVHHVFGSKTTGQNKELIYDPYPNGARLSSDFVITSDISTNDTAFQTDVNLPTLLDPATADTPSGDGDFVVRITSTAGANTDFDIDLTFSFHGHD